MAIETVFFCSTIKCAFAYAKSLQILFTLSPAAILSANNSSTGLPSCFLFQLPPCNHRVYVWKTSTV